MRRFSHLIFISGLCTLLFAVACTEDRAEQNSDTAFSAEEGLTVAEARAFFEHDMKAAVTRSDLSGGLFTWGDAVLEWGDAESSAVKKMASVDVPVRPEYAYYVTRWDVQGRPYTVRAWAKLVVVRSNVSQLMESYIRYCIPDEAYAALYDGDIGTMTLNCEDRVDYCGLELYTTLEGIPAAAARYVDGKCTAGVFLFDDRYSPERRQRCFGRLFHDMYIVQRSCVATRGGFLYGDRDWLIDSNGFIYMLVDTDGDGIKDAATQYFDEWVPGGGPVHGGAGDGGGAGDSGSGTGDGAGGSDSGSGGQAGGGGGSGNSGSWGGEGGKVMLPILIPGEDDPCENPDPPKPPKNVDPIPFDYNDLEDSQEQLNDGSTEPKEVDCEEIAPEAGNNSVKTNELYDRMKGVPSYSEFLGKVGENGGIEYGTTGYRDDEGNFCMIPPYTDNNPHGLQVRLARGKDNLTMVHNHPSGWACSIEDVVALIRLNLGNVNFNAIYVCISNGPVYVIYIYDRDVMHQFSVSENFECLKGQYEAAFSCFRTQGYGRDMAHLYAIAYALKQLNTGIAVLSKSEADATFHQHGIERSECDSLGIPKLIETIKCK